MSKPPVAGRVKTRLIGPYTPEQAASLHAAFLDDLAAELSGESSFELMIAWALAEDEAPPRATAAWTRQSGADLGARIHDALSSGLRHGRRGSTDEVRVAVIGADHPLLSSQQVARAFARLEAGADVVIGPAEDGGYYLLGGRERTLPLRLFEGIEWSTARVLRQTLERCEELELRVELLETGWDVDRPEDVLRLADALSSSDVVRPATRQALESVQPVKGVSTRRSPSEEAASQTGERS